MWSKCRQSDSMNGAAHLGSFTLQLAQAIRKVVMVVLLYGVC